MKIRWHIHLNIILRVTEHTQVKPQRDNDSYVDQLKFQYIFTNAVYVQFQYIFLLFVFSDHFYLVKIFFLFQNSLILTLLFPPLSFSFIRYFIFFTSSLNFLKLYLISFLFLEIYMAQYFLFSKTSFCCYVISSKLNIFCYKLCLLNKLLMMYLNLIL